MHLSLEPLVFEFIEYIALSDHSLLELNLILCQTLGLWVIKKPEKLKKYLNSIYPKFNFEKTHEVLKTIFEKSIKEKTLHELQFVDIVPGGKSFRLERKKKIINLFLTYTPDFF